MEAKEELYLVELRKKRCSLIKLKIKELDLVELKRLVDLAMHLLMDNKIYNAGNALNEAWLMLHYAEELKCKK